MVDKKDSKNVKAISKKLEKFFETIATEATKIGLTTSINQQSSKLVLSFSEAQNERFEIVVSKTLKYVSIYEPRGLSLKFNRYILDFVDILTTDFKYQLSSSGIHSGANDDGLIAGSVWAILEKIGS